MLPALLIFAVGCGGNSNRGVSLSGKVMLNGTPVTGGTMTLHIGEAVYPVAISTDGSYSAIQLPEGEAVATVDTEALNPNKPKYGGKGGGMSPMPEGTGKGPAGAYRKIPTKYRNKATSDLKVTLKSGSQEKTFEMKE